MTKLDAGIPSNSHASPIWFDPVSVPKAVRYFALPPTMTELIAPNHDELEALIQEMAGAGGQTSSKASHSNANNSSDSKELVQFYAERVWAGDQNHIMEEKEDEKGNLRPAYEFVRRMRVDA